MVSRFVVYGNTKIGFGKTVLVQALSPQQKGKFQITKEAEFITSYNSKRFHG